MSDEGRRRKKSWREIDRGKDKSLHRRVEHPGTSPYQRRTNKSYKAELDRFFEHGVASQRIKTLMKKGGPDTAAPSDDGGENAEKVSLIRSIRGAETFDEFVTSVEQLREKYGLPNDVDILIRVLEHPDDEPIRDALGQLIELTRRLTLTQVKQLKARLDTLESFNEDPEILEAIATLRAKI